MILVNPIIVVNIVRVNNPITNIVFCDMFFDWFDTQ